MRKAIPTLVVARAIMHDVTPRDGTVPPVEALAPPAPVPYVAPVPVPVVATPTPKPVPVDRAIQDPAPTPAPVVVAGVPIRTYTRGAPYKCPKCKRVVPVGGSVACDVKGKMLCLTCIGAPVAPPVDRAAPAAVAKPQAPAPAIAQAPAPKSEAPVTVDTAPAPVDHDSHVTAYLEIETAPKPVEAKPAAPVVTCGKCGTTAGPMVKSPRGRTFCPACAKELAQRASKSAAIAAPILPDAAPVEKPASPKGTVLDAFMLDDLCRAVDAVLSTPESVDDVGKAAETALDALLAAIDDEEPIVDKCINDAGDLLTEYDEPEATVEALRARLDEARTKLDGVSGAVTHMVTMLRDAYTDVKDKVEDLANLQQRNAEESEALDVEALVREFEYRGYRIERVKR